MQPLLNQKGHEYVFSHLFQHASADVGALERTPAHACKRRLKREDLGTGPQFFKKRDSCSCFFRRLNTEVGGLVVEDRRYSVKNEGQEARAFPVFRVFTTIHKDVRLP